MRIEGACVEKYAAYLCEPHRFSSQGGNGRAWHVHALTIEKTTYSFLSMGRRKWAYRHDTVSFNWSDVNGRRQIDRDSIQVCDRDGKSVSRGIRESTPWESAEVRFPVERRKWNEPRRHPAQGPPEQQEHAATSLLAEGLTGFRESRA